MKTITINISAENSVSEKRKGITSIMSSGYTLMGIGNLGNTTMREADKGKNFLAGWYSTELLRIILLSLLFLSYIDGYLTLILIKKDIVVEANPIMAFYLDYGDISFLLAKFFITGLSLLIFCICKNLTIVKVALPSSLIIYFLVVIYELTIMYKFYPHF